MIVYILIIFLFALSFLPKIRKINRFGIINNKFNDFKFTNSILLIWIVVGFFTRLDFSQMMGDIIYGEKIFDYNNIGFSSISFLLILTARLLKNGKGKIIIILLELLFWSFKYFYYKGGYAMGLGASYPNDLIVLFDFVALLLRFRLIGNIKQTKILEKWRIYLVVILFVTIKIFIFPFPHDLFRVTKRIYKKTESTKTLLIGNWTGKVSYDSTWLDTIAKYRLDTISNDLKNSFEFGADRTQIDPTHKYAFKEMNKPILASANISINDSLIVSTKWIDCKMDFQYYDWGQLIQEDTLHYGSFKIWSVDEDSLIITITEGMGKNYKYKLIRE